MPINEQIAVDEYYETCKAMKRDLQGLSKLVAGPTEEINQIKYPEKVTDLKSFGRDDVSQSLKYIQELVGQLDKKVEGKPENILDMKEFIHAELKLLEQRAKNVELVFTNKRLSGFTFLTKGNAQGSASNKSNKNMARPKVKL